MFRTRMAGYRAETNGRSGCMYVRTTYSMLMCSFRVVSNKVLLVRIDSTNSHSYRSTADGDDACRQTFCPKNDNKNEKRKRKE